MATNVNRMHVAMGLKSALSKKNIYKQQFPAIERNVPSKSSAQNGPGAF